MNVNADEYKFMIPNFISQLINDVDDAAFTHAFRWRVQCTWTNASPFPRINFDSLKPLFISPFSLLTMLLRFLTWCVKSSIQHDCMTCRDISEVAVNLDIYIGKTRTGRLIAFKNNIVAETKCLLRKPSHCISYFAIEFPEVSQPQKLMETDGN